jgi:hypothetical protein
MDHLMKRYCGRDFSPTSASEPQALVLKPVHQLGELQLQRVKPAISKLWNKFIERDHYLGFTPLPGSTALFCDAGWASGCLTRVWRSGMAGRPAR